MTPADIAPAALGAIAGYGLAVALYHRRVTRIRRLLAELAAARTAIPRTARTAEYRRRVVADIAARLPLAYAAAPHTALLALPLAAALAA